MNDRIKNAVERARSGKLSKKELENLRNNALRIGDAEELILACDEMLSKLPKRGKSGGRKSSVDIAEKKDGYNIMRSAYTENGILRKPELVDVAEELAKNKLVSDISIIKTQIKLYYKGRHFTAACKPDKSLFWVAILDETKITDSTIKKWAKLGEINTGTYYGTNYIAVKVPNIETLHTALEYVIFT